MFQMRLTDVRREVDEMLEGFEHQATFSLKKIDRRFESLGQSLDEEFRQYFLQVSIEILSTSYTKVQIESYRNQTETGGFTNEPSTQPGYGLTDDDQPTCSILGSLVKEERTNSVDDDDNVNVKWEEVETQLDSMVEKLSSSDDKGIVDSQNYRLQTKIECEETDWMSDATGNEVSHNNDEESRDEVTIKEELDIEPEMINDPVRIFNPNDVVSNGGCRTNDDFTNGNEARANDESDAQKPSCSKDSKRFNCELCEYGTNYNGHLSRHMRTHTNEKPFRCSCCPKRFVTSLHFKAHMVTHRNEFPFHCSKCLHGFFLDNEKVTHEKNCTFRRYECYVCKYVTINKTHLVMHMWTHTGNKPHRCGRCSKAFAQLWILKRHMTTHKDKKLPFHCRGCFHRFSEESEKEAHEKSCRNRRYECEICKKYVTADKNQMEMHIRTHTGEKPFGCEVCKKCFTRKADLKRHLNGVHNRSNL